MRNLYAEAMRLARVDALLGYQMRVAGPLSDVSKLRHQAVFFVGAGGSGKGYVGYKWLKYMPGGGGGGVDRKTYEEWEMEGGRGRERPSEGDRGLSGLSFQNVAEKLQAKGVKIVPNPDGSATIPFDLYTYDERGKEHHLDPSEWAEALPPHLYREVEGLVELTFASSEKEVPGYFRQINPDIYKAQIPGYDPKDPGYVHEMSSTMSKAYFEAALETGDPLIVDGTGSDAAKVVSQIGMAKAAGYRTSLVYVSVPLTVNQIRNAVRPRNVNPNIITKQWNKIRETFSIASKLVDKSRVVDNRNDSADFKAYRNNRDRVEGLIQTETAYASLFDLVSDQNPSELASYGKLLKGG